MKLIVIRENDKSFKIQTVLDFSADKKQESNYDYSIVWCEYQDMFILGFGELSSHRPSTDSNNQQHTEPRHRLDNK
jgi:hypothetical protein